MNRVVRTALVSGLFAIASIAVASDTHGQQSQRKKKLTPHQEYAIHLLDSVIDESREVESIEERTALAEAIIPLLASTQPERCRQMLDAIFEAALRRKEDSAREKKENTLDPDATIRRIIQAAARLDRKLADSYIEKYARDKESETSETSPNPALTKRAADLYMRMAVDLVEKDPGLAVSAAQRALSVSVPIETLTFLAKLRQKDTKLANGLFVSALSGLKKRGAFDINELLLLYSHVFSPMQVLQATPQGLGILSIASYRPMSFPIDPELAQSYLIMATQIILSSVRYQPETFGRLVEGPAGDMIFINIIEPQVATYLPALVYPLSERQNFLASFLQPDRRQETQDSINRWRKSFGDDSTSKARPDSSDYYLRSAENAVDSKRKNQLFYRAASAAAREKKYEFALTIVDKMSDEYREQARQFIKYHIASQAARDGTIDVAREWARSNSDLTQRAYVYTLLAEVLLKTPQQTISLASELLDEVEEIAGKLDQNRERSAVLIGAAGVASEFDVARAFRLLRDGIRAANKMDNFSGDNSVSRMLDLGGFYYDYSLYRSDLTFTDTVSRLARANFDEAVVDVREVKNRFARLRAIVLVCSVLPIDKPVDPK